MRSRRFGVLFLILSLTWCLAGAAFAGSGTLKGAFYSKNPVTGAESALTGGYVYLHNAVNPPPMEKFLSKADFIYNITFIPFSLSVPEGSYYIRMLQRKPGSSAGAYGPPQAGDLTWMQQTPISIVAGATLDLQKKYAVTFAAAPVIITGTVKTSAGTPLAGRYVRAQLDPCLPPENCTDAGCQQYGNQCGPVKYLALAPTDANGSYTLYLADSGSYYIYASSCLMPGHNFNDDSTRCQFTAASPKPFKVNRGERITVDVIDN